MCPYYLDGDLRAAYAALGDTRVIGYCAVFKVREEACSQPVTPQSRRRRAGLSKLNSMRAASSGRKARPRDLPGPVDMSSGRSRSGERRGARELGATIRRRSVPSG